MATTGMGTRASRRLQRRCGGRSRGGHGTRSVAGVALGCVVALTAAPADAQEWRFTPSLGFEETLTNNVKLQPSATREGDFVTQITPGFRVSEQGARSSLTGDVALPILIYARTGSENNEIRPLVNLTGTYELAEKFLYIEGNVSITRQFLTPFGAQPTTFSSATDNAYRSEIYRLTPYIKGVAAGDVSYELRDNNVWAKGSANSIDNSYSNEVIGSLRRDPKPFGWGVDYDRTDTKFSSQDPLLTELARLRGLYQPDPELELSASVGYERNDYLLTQSDNAIYGASVRWRPSDRTSLDAGYEHRFFGASYNFAFNHRRPLSVWSLSASRNITSYPQQLASLPGGIDVASALNALFSGRVSDPAARETIVNQYILDRGLPPVLTGPVTLYTQQVTLQEILQASVGLLGARNSVFFGLFRQRNEPINANGNILPPDLATLFNDNTQIGGNVVWSYSFTGLTSLTASVDASKSTGNSQPGTTRQGSARLSLNTSLSPLTSLYAGIRYQVLRSDVTFSYNEAAIFVGVNHQFR